MFEHSGVENPYIGTSGIVQDFVGIRGILGFSGVSGILQAGREAAAAVGQCGIGIVQTKNCLHHWSNYKLKGGNL